MEGFHFLRGGGIIRSAGEAPRIRRLFAAVFAGRHPHLTAKQTEKIIVIPDPDTAADFSVCEIAGGQKGRGRLDSQP